MKTGADYIVEPPDLFGRRFVCGFGTQELFVRIGNREQVGEVIKANHYSGTVVWSSNLHLFIFWQDAIIGAMQFGPAMNPASGANIVSGATADEWLELNRLALSDDKPEHAASRSIAYGIRCIRAMRPRVKWIQSFADERCGKLGAIYQACSFVYCGVHVGRFFELDGEMFHQSAWGRKDKRGWGIGPKLTRFNENRDRAVKKTFKQYRYIKFIDTRYRKRLLLTSLPYPKPGIPL